MSTATTIVTGIDFVSLPTQDLDRASDFYADVLGLEAVQRLAAAREGRRSAPSSRTAP